MPPLDDNIEDLDTSSPGSDTLDVAAEASAPDVNSAESSDAQGVATDDTLSIVRNVVDDSQTDAGAASPAEGDEVEGQSADDPNSTDKDDEDYSDVPFHKHPRFQHLLKKSKTYEADATRYQNVQNFMDHHGISAEEAADGFLVMGLLKTDPIAAWERLKPVVQQLLIATGEVLPEDLKQRVQAGELTAEAAHEVSKARATVQTVQTTQTFHQQQGERKRAVELHQSLIGTAEGWEQDRQKKDPNYEAKKLPLMKELAFIQSREGKPNTPQGVKDQLDRAYKAVVPAPVAQPNPQRKQKPLSSAGGIVTNAQPKPETTLDIIRQVTAR